MSYSQDLCTTGRSGAFQGQIFGLSGGRTVVDENCERLKLSKYIYDMGMKVAAVALLCQDTRVFQAMEMAGTPCPYMGDISADATSSWKENAEKRPDYKAYKAKLKADNKKAKKKEKVRYSNFMKECKDTRWPEGTEHAGKWQSKKTCKKQWAESNT